MTDAASGLSKKRVDRRTKRHASIDVIAMPELAIVVEAARAERSVGHEQRGVVLPRPHPLRASDPRELGKPLVRLEVAEAELHARTSSSGAAKEA